MVLLITLVGFAGRSSGEFDLSKHNVPLEQIISGGPGKDGILAILNPLFVRATAEFLAAEDRVVGLVHGHEAKAYPIKILNWHEVVNDTMDGQSVVITYCPLCGTGIGFEAVIHGRRSTFDVSGLLYQSDLLMYDHQTESLWSQIAMEAVAGPMTRTKLRPIFLTHTTWGEWRHDYPSTLVLSTKTGYTRDYDRDPYLGYAQRPDLMFTTNHRDRRYHPKEWVLGVEVDGSFKAYPFSELNKVKTPLTDTVNGQEIRIIYNRQARTGSITTADGVPLPSMLAFWFAWSAFHPNTEVFAVTR